MKTRIPLFPLKLVLFPHSKYPLHIFEERYKKLINRCINSGEHFGIVTSMDSNFSKVGCLASVNRILKNHPNGSFDILVSGIHRFKTQSTVLVKDGYLEANVVLFDDKEKQYDELLYNKTVDKLLEVLKTAKIKLDSEFWASLTAAEFKSFKLAEKAGLNLKQQQKILSCKYEKERLTYLYTHLTKIETIIEESKIKQQLISGDGYLNE